MCSTHHVIYFIQIQNMIQRWKPPIISVRLDFLKCVQICIFFKSLIFTHMPVQILSSVSRFAFVMKIEIWIPTLEKIYTHLRKFGQVCVSRFAFWRKWKCRHTWENLDGQKLLRVSNSEDTKWELKDKILTLLEMTP